MIYIIMCGGVYPWWKEPRQLLLINGEPIVQRTIRLLQEVGVAKKDIRISSNYPEFKEFGVDVIEHDNKFNCGPTDWVDAFCVQEEPCCYIFGDVVFSKNALKTIVETETNDIQFFASAPPFAKEYVKSWAEPFALKVVNINHFVESLNKFREYEKQKLFLRKPGISWELWQVIIGIKINTLRYDNYCIINDYTCDVDSLDDIKKFERLGDLINE